MSRVFNTTGPVVAANRYCIIFDRRDQAWEDRVFHRRESVGAADVHVWGM